MARTLELTWHKPTKRWKKYRNGNLYYFKFGTSKSDTDGYQQALAAWRKLEAELEAADDAAKPGRDQYQRLIARYQERIDWLRRFATDEAGQEVLAQHQSKVEELRQRMAEPVPPPISTDDMLADDVFQESVRQQLGGTSTTADPERIYGVLNQASIEAGAVWADRQRTLAVLTNKPELGRTVDEAIAQFRNRKVAQAAGAQLSAGRCEVLRIALEKFSRHFGGSRSIDEIDGEALLGYQAHLLGEVGAKTIRPAYAKDQLAAVTQWVRWLWTTERIANLPRCLRDRTNRELVIKVPRQKVTGFDVADVKRMLAGTTDRTKLYLLLALNCGFTQIDIANLTIAAVDLKAKTITWKRSKTKDEENVPEVCYPLWSQTVELLRKERGQHDTLWLTNEDGGPLKVEELNGGKLRKNDNIRNAFARLCRKLGIKQAKFKLLRKTASSMLDNNNDYARFAQHFLGHAPQTTAGTHYVTPSANQFRNAIAWLGQQFGIK